MVEKIIWGWVLIDNGTPKYMSFNKYKDSTYLWSTDPNDDYTIEEKDLCLSKNQLLDEQIENCNKKIAYWNKKIQKYTSMKDV